MIRTRSISPFVPLALVALGAGCQPGDPGGGTVGQLAQAQGVANTGCIFGTCIIATPTVVNVYWDGVTTGVWDAHHPSATSGQLDTLTEAVIRSDYFTGLQQYSLQSITRGASLVPALCDPPTGDLDAVHDQLGTLGNCIKSKYGFNTDNTILNVFVPSYVPLKPGSNNWCPNGPGGGGNAAEHDKYGSPYAITFLPLTCNDTLERIVRVETHELVEAITDPVPQSSTGWKDRSVLPTQEIGDLCQSGAGNKASFLVPSFKAAVSTYWSNADSGCIAGITHPAPTINQVTACGSGNHMKFTVKGQSFGPAPWDLVTVPPFAGDPGRSTSIYLQAGVAPIGASKWSAGNVGTVPADPVKLGPVTWTPGGNGSDVITINGFDSNYGNSFGGVTSALNPGDPVKIQVTSVATGLTDSQTVFAPMPVGFGSLTVSATDQFGYPADGWIFFGKPAAVFGTVVDAGNCGEQNTHVQMDVNDWGSPQKITHTDADGKFTILYTSPGSAGKRQAVIYPDYNLPSSVISLEVHPYLGDLDNNVGDSGGGQVLKVSGAGFPTSGPLLAGMKVLVRNLDLNVSTTATFTVLDANTLSVHTPKSPLPGQGQGSVDIVAVVDGLESNPISYLYAVPYQAILKVVPPTCPGLPAQLLTDAYSPSGMHVVEPLLLTSPAAIFPGPSVSININSGATVSLAAMAGQQITITATPQPQMGLPLGPPITQTFTVSSDNQGGCSWEFAAQDYFTFDPGGPVESVTLVPYYSPEGDSLLWTPPTVGAGGLSISLSTRGGATPKAPTLNVRQVGEQELHSLTRGGSIASLAPRTQRYQGTLKFDGPSFALAPQRGFAGQATLTFTLPAGAEPTRYCVVATSPYGATWIESPSTVNVTRTGATLSTRVSAGATYALAELR